MGERVTLPVLEEDRRFVERAIERVDAFWPGVSVTNDGDVVVLRSERHGDAELGGIWRCALLNERLTSTGAARRERVLSELLA